MHLGMGVNIRGLHAEVSSSLTQCGAWGAIPFFNQSVLHSEFQASWIYIVYPNSPNKITKRSNVTTQNPTLILVCLCPSTKKWTEGRETEKEHVISNISLNVRQKRKKEKKMEKSKKLKHSPEREPGILELLFSIFNPGGNC